MINTIKIVILEAIIAIVAVFLWGKWQFHEGVQSVKQQVKIETRYIEKESPKVTKQIEVRYKDRVKVIHEKGDTIIKKVPVYVTKEDDTRCVINTGFVQLWNDANKMQFSDTTSAFNATPSPIVLTDVAAQHAREAKLYHETAERLISLQNWVKQQQALYSDGG